MVATSIYHTTTDFSVINVDRMIFFSVQVTGTPTTFTVQGRLNNDDWVILSDRDSRSTQRTNADPSVYLISAYDEVRVVPTVSTGLTLIYKTLSNN